MIFQNRVMIIGWLELTEATRKSILKRLQKSANTTRVFAECTTLEIYGDTGSILVALAMGHKILVC